MAVRSFPGSLPLVVKRRLEVIDISYDRVEKLCSARILTYILHREKCLMLKFAKALFSSISCSEVDLS